MALQIVHLFLATLWQIRLKVAPHAPAISSSVAYMASGLSGLLVKIMIEDLFSKIFEHVVYFKRAASDVSQWTAPNPPPVLAVLVPDRRSRNLKLVVVRRTNNLGTGNLEWGGSGEN